MKIKLSLSIIFCLWLFISGCDNKEESASPQIAVTNSYLFCAVRDICGSQQEIVLLAAPGMCPGHFDMPPSMVRQLAECKLLLRFDFQDGIDTQLNRFAAQGLSIMPVSGLPGMCIPQVYAQMCHEICQILSAKFPENQALYRTRLSEIEVRMEALSDEIHSVIEQHGLREVNVISSIHQTVFAESLGLNVAGTFIGQDIATPAVIQQCLESTAGKTICCVIANRQEGVQLAESLAGRLSTKAVAFSNFPSILSEEGFDVMVRDNVQGLVAVYGR